MRCRRKSIAGLLSVMLLHMLCQPVSLFGGPAQQRAAAKGKAKRVSAIERVASVEGITEYRLPNGLRVLLFPDPTKLQSLSTLPTS